MVPSLYPPDAVAVAPPITGYCVGPTGETHPVGSLPQGEVLPGGGIYFLPGDLLSARSPGGIGVHAREFTRRGTAFPQE